MYLQVFGRPEDLGPSDTEPRTAELLPDGLVAAVGEGRIVTTMTAFAGRITGLDPAHVLGRDIVDALPLRDRSGRSWWEVASPWVGLSTRTGHREALLHLPDGLEVLVTARYVRSERLGPVSAVVLCLRDAEGRRRAEARHAALITTLAHELRSPLTGVKGFTTTLLERWDLFSDEQKRLLLTTIEADADRVARLITELLDVSRLDTGRLTVRCQRVDAAAMVLRHLERLVSQGEDPGRFVVELSDSGDAWADPDRLEQVLANLVENALRHGRGAVYLALRDTPCGVELTVADDGPGVPEHLRSLVFRKFWRGEKSHSTGLGLYLVKGLMDAQGGTVVIEDRDPAPGARIRVTLPHPPA